MRAVLRQGRVRSGVMGGAMMRTSCRSVPSRIFSAMAWSAGSGGASTCSVRGHLGLASVQGLPAWLSQHGGYRNGAAGKPLFVSLLVYLDEYWKAEWDAETLFVDPESGAGLLVQPRPGRAVLMHQDVLHRVSTPSLLARRPRYSLVWKLIFIPKKPDGADDESICRPAEWGTPVRLGGVGAAAGA